ncbi:MAG TPA: hypothetical protein VEV39_01900 [Gemmatimonadales bacterium]|nr:hypothetical protein [Gemmatimonadales bacterium]
MTGGALTSEYRTGDWSRVVVLVGQLVLALAAVYALQLENRTVFAVLVLAVLGFVVHDRLPPKYRLPFFATLSLGSTVAVLGFPGSLYVIGVGATLIAVCHAPLGYRLRVVILLVLGAALCWLRAWPGMGDTPALVGPALGGMFMFRTVLYAKSVNDGVSPHGPWWAVAYFFMMPNVCYPFFPVVDYDTFVATHYDSERFRIYDRGLRYILRGILQLLAYRVVYYGLAMDSLYVDTPGELLRYVVSNFLLYTKVSGQFHLIVGILSLYGFRLPETNHLYVLASSPTEFWRRINIYWKDFMLKVVYTPSFFRLRRYGQTFAIVAATVMVFIASWFLHSYQYFWIQGEWQIMSRRNALFWGIFAILVVGATIWEIQPGRRQRPRTTKGWSLRRGVTTLLTFGAVASLWSLWNAETGGTWMMMWSEARRGTLTDWVAFAALVSCFVAFAGFAWGAARLETPQSEPEPWRTIAIRGGRRVAVLGVLVMVGLPAFWNALPDRYGDIGDSLHGRGESAAGFALVQRGYYQALTTENDRTARPWVPPPNYTHEWEVFGPQKDFLQREYPRSAVITFRGRRLTTNRWGFRGHDYELAKPRDTYRIEIYGASDLMGWGVGDQQVFSTLLEAALDSAARTRGMRAEVMNFSVPGTSVAQEVALLANRGMRFQPDLVLLSVHPYELWSLEETFHAVQMFKWSIPDTGLSRLASGAGVDAGGQGTPANLRLIEAPVEERALHWAAQLVQGTGARLAVMEVRLPDLPGDFNLGTVRQAVRESGLPPLDCTGIWQGKVIREYRVSTVDTHPNAAGHALLANCLLQALQANAAALNVLPLAGSR